MRDSVLMQQSMDFAVSILQLRRRLEDAWERVLADQLCRSGTSIGANIREAQYAQSKADFIHKLQIALKEANETLYWLELLFRGGLIDERCLRKYSDDCTSLLKMLISSVNTAKNTIRRRSRLHNYSLFTIRYSLNRLKGVFP